MIRIFLYSTGIFLIPFVFVLGATDTFTVATLVGDDTTPPSVPGSFTATPVATSQIDLAWATSTDDFVLSGYHVWRDDVQIATTTLTTYSDTGLIASTLYTYYVTAFDSSNNVSASSTVVSTTTLSSSTPATPLASSTTIFGSRSSLLRDIIISLQILPQRDTVSIQYITDGYVRTTIKWGRSSSYELGSLAERAFSENHETYIEGLTPGTTYRFIIEGEDKIGRYGILHTGTFTTLPPLDTFPPGNVRNLEGVHEEDDFILSWVNPTDPDLAKIRVVRNDRFYPSDPADGWVVYEGLGNMVRDIGAASIAPQQYYTVFSYDALGNISSGAVVLVSKKGIVVVPEVDPTKNEIALTFEDITFIQEGNILLRENGRILIDGSKQFTIEIPYDRVPEHLKTILVTISEDSRSTRSFSFLLRVNGEKSAYVGTVAPLTVAGNFPLQVAVFDFETAQIGYAHGSLVSHILPGSIDGNTDDTFGGFTEFFSNLGKFNLLLFILLLILLAFASRRILRTEW